MNRHAARKPRFLISLLVAAATIFPPHIAAAASSGRPSLPSSAGSASLDSNLKLLDRMALDSGSSLFLPAVAYDPGALGTNSIAIGDVNGDGILDVVVVNCEPYGSPPCGNNGNVVDGVIAVLLGYGDGTFAPPLTYDSGGANAESVAIADVNGDSRPDLVVANCAPGGTTGCGNYPGGSISVLFGNGDGTFRAPVVYASGGISAMSVKVADLNSDGKADIVVANSFDTVQNSKTGLVGVLLGNGDGTFQTVVTYPSGEVGASSVAIADVNGDHKLDVVVGNGDCPNTSDAQCAGVLLGNGDGTLQPVVTYKSGGGEVTSIAVADVNVDGKPDLLVTNWCVFCANTVGVLLGNGDGTFQPPVTYGSGGYFVWSVTAADVDGDGKLDLLVANACSAKLDHKLVECKDSQGPIGVLLNNGDGTFQPVTTFASGGDGAIMVVATDVNGDGRPDVIVANHGVSLTSGSVGVLLNNSTSTQRTETTVTSSLNPSDFGQSVTFTAQVTSASGTPTGTVVFFEGSTSLGSAELSKGSASLSTSSLSAGAHSITAAYQGSEGFDPSTSTVLIQVVNGARLFASKTKLTTSGSPSFVGQPVIFTATVTSNGGAIPNGELVTFYDGSAEVGTGTTSGGLASFTTSSLTAKRNNINAVYAGDGVFKTSHGMVTEIVNKYPTTTNLVSSMNPAIYGQPITYTVTVTSSGPGAPTGRVRLTGVGSLPLVGGVASVTKNQVRVGTHSLTAEYLGDDESAESKSQVLAQVVTPASTTTTITSSANPSSSGQAVTFTAMVISSTGPDPYGTVTFTAGSTTLGTVSLTDTKASISTSTLPVGSTLITATYNGSPSFIGSSASLTQVVQH